MKPEQRLLDGLMEIIFSIPNCVELVFSHLDLKTGFRKAMLQRRRGGPHPAPPDSPARAEAELQLPRRRG